MSSIVALDTFTTARYRIMGLLKYGGMGSVYAAYDHCVPLQGPLKRHAG